MCLVATPLRRRWEYAQSGVDSHLVESNLHAAICVDVVDATTLTWMERDLLSETIVTDTEGKRAEATS